MLPIHKILWHEWREKRQPVRVPEPEAMVDPEQIRAYVKAYEWGGPTSALQFHHLRELSRLIRSGDTVVDLACGPGPLLLELAPVYPDCRFIGVDLSQPMLEVLSEESRSKGLDNVETRCDDIRRLKSLEGQRVDVVITTSALHHLPDEGSLEETLGRVGQLLTDDSGGFYAFDFGLLRSQRTRDLLVQDISLRGALPVTSLDYAHSLAAAFAPDSVISLARRSIPVTLEARVSRFVDFFYFIQSPERVVPCQRALARQEEIWSGFTVGEKTEYFMLRALRRRSSL